MDNPFDINSYENGKFWYYNIFDENLRNELRTIYNILIDVKHRLLMSKSKDSIIPNIEHVMYPLISTDFNTLKYIIIGKEPYRNYTGSYTPVATGYPINTSDGSSTPTSNIFMKLINTELGGNNNVGHHMISQHMSSCGIMILNCVPTFCNYKDKRYATSLSHKTAWSGFIIKFINMLISHDKKIILLGSEGKDLIPFISSKSKNSYYSSEFPTPATEDKFLNFMHDILTKVDE